MDLSMGMPLPADAASTETQSLALNEMPAPIDEQALVAEVNADYAEWARQKRPFEGNWYLNAAFLRGEQNAVFNSTQGRLITPQSPTYRVKPRINRILPKVRGRNAKFFKNRPKPVVIPASTERKDILDARGTEKAILYTWARQRMEEKHKDARSWATIGAKGFWWIRWNDALTARVMVKDAQGMPQPQTLQLGDVEIEVGSPFELFVANPAEPRIGKQPKIIRARLRNRKDMMQRYPALTKLANAGVGSADAPVRIADRIAQLNPNLGSGFNVGSSKDTHESMVLVLEHFTAPNAAHPKGRYAVVIGDELAKVTDELPYEMWDHAYNPYPVIEFRDMLSAGQFWNTTLVEQLIDLQREYNEVRGLIRENLRAVSRPKIIVYKQHNLAEGAYTSQCVDPETEILTKDGWKNYTTLKIGEDILAYDPDTDRADWQSLQALHVDPDYDGELYHLTGHSIDALVTPNHKWLLEQMQTDKRLRKLKIETDALSEVGKRWTIPLARAVKFSKGPQLPDAFLELLGWIIGDGHLHVLQNSLNLYQKKPHGIARLRELFQTLGMTVTERRGARDVTRFYVSSAVALEFREYLNADKTLSFSFIASLNQAQLQALFNGLVASDGTIAKQGEIKFFNTNHDLCIMVQYIATLLGRRSYIWTDRKAQSKRFKKGFGDKVYQCKTQYVVSLGTLQQGNRVVRSTTIGSLTTTKQEYQGTVWCPQVSTGFCYYKRNGRIYVSGNSGEVLELNWVPSLPPPMILQAANVANDCWNILALISKEFDDLSQIYPSAEGKAGQATSGYQTMLLQESADGVHAPDIREDEMAIEEAGWKIRRLMKLMYDVPRLISILGPNAAPEVMEFHNSQIDEFAEVRIQAGSMLPDLKAARIQTVQEMFKAGLFGNVQDPQVRRKVLEMIEIGGMDVTTEDERRDTDEANQENFALQQGTSILSAMFYEDHITHIFVHQNALKTTEWIKGNPQQRLALIAHLITHYDFVNPALAGGLRQQFNMPQLPIATPPMTPQAPPPPPPPKLAVGLALKGEDMANPIVQALLTQEGVHLAPPLPPPQANPVHTHGPLAPPQPPHAGPPQAPATPSAAPLGPAPTAPIPAR